MNLSYLGKLLLLVGGVIVAAGLVLLLVGRMPYFGRLPGDMRLRWGSTTVFFPIVSCILASVVLTVLLNLLLFLFRRR